MDGTRGIRFSFHFQSDVKLKSHDKHNRKLEMKIQGPEEPNGLLQKEWNSLLRTETPENFLMINRSLMVKVPLERARALNSEGV